jgi:hypothetical protein
MKKKSFDNIDHRLIAEPPTTDFLVDRGKNILVCGGVDVR